MVEVVRYQPALAQAWDSFVAQAKNGHFMFTRLYLSYHADRFQDASLLFYYRGKLVALLPAHQQAQQLISHGGLTFGGLVTGSRMTLGLMQEVFAALRDFMWQQGWQELLYRAMPACYHQMPAQEDAAVLYQLGAQLTARQVTSVIDLQHRPKYYKGISWSLQKARKGGIRVQPSPDFSGFMQMLTQMLAQRYQARPVHSLAEITQLATWFPENIQLWEARSSAGDLLAGTILYVTAQTAHTQYIASTAEGKQQGAVAWLLHSLLAQFGTTKQYFSLGTSRGGAYVNDTLYHFKESLGARAQLQEQYVWRINN